MMAAASGWVATAMVAAAPLVTTKTMVRRNDPPGRRQI
jgi:hypothetical protein